MQKINIRLRHQLDLDHLVRAIEEQSEENQEEIMEYLNDSLGTERSELDHVEWYKGLEDEEKKEFLSAIGVRRIDLTPVKMTKSYPVQSRSSSSIVRIGYNDEQCRLEITFSRGGNEDSYQYAFVPPVVFEGLLATDSIGRYYNSEIKGQYISIKV